MEFHRRLSLGTAIYVKARLSSCRPMLSLGRKTNQGVIYSVRHLTITKHQSLQLIFLALAIASIVVPLWMASPQTTPLTISMYALCATSAVVAVVLVFTSGPQIRKYKVNDRSGIRDYLFDWISNGRNVAIWTRNMTWVDDEEMRDMLHGKAAAGELTVCLPVGNDRSADLQEHGAQIVEYGQFITPASTFTIINYGRAGSRVAVGAPRGNKHIIQEYSTDEHPAFHMAQDLVGLVSGYEHERRGRSASPTSRSEDSRRGRE